MVDERDELVTSISTEDYIKYNEVQNKKTATLPTLEEFRKDKSERISYDEVVELIDNSPNDKNTPIKSAVQPSDSRVMSLEELKVISSDVSLVDKAALSTVGAVFKIHGSTKLLGQKISNFKDSVLDKINGIKSALGISNNNDRGI